MADSGSSHFGRAIPSANTTRSLLFHTPPAELDLGLTREWHTSTSSLSVRSSYYFCAGKVHVRNTAEQLKLVGPRSLGVSLLTAGFVGMVFTIQVRELA